MKRLLLLIGMAGCHFFSAQVGVGTVSPNLKSVLDVNASNKGMMFPKINLVTRNAMTMGAPESSMWIMNTDTKIANFWNGTQWRNFLSVKPAVFTMDCTSIVSSNYLTVNKPATGFIQVVLTVSEPGAVSLQTNTINGVRFIGAQGVSSGSVVFTLDAVGTPTASGDVNFTLVGGGATCTIPVRIR
ncbi:hypothetical protein QWZ06_24430 [Chryseobacterium tructae]|uniref:Uncharacterized protein n=1 Tax=Chryseobacterium tructae TaxID=1037380 RepID=A0ABV7XQU1_9FLAO|nr:hypothetical protein [Chryseobacterium tructae]MDN3695153.1 hypothetical protein [Chryseobacterium tructae]